MHSRRGFGLAVRAGLDRFEGDAVEIVMGDGSGEPNDLVRYHRLLEEGQISWANRTAGTSKLS
jgi:hypothetical protein